MWCSGSFHQSSDFKGPLLDFLPHVLFFGQWPMRIQTDRLREVVLQSKGLKRGLAHVSAKGHLGGTSANGSLPGLCNDATCTQPKLYAEATPSPFHLICPTKPLIYALPGSIQSIGARLNSPRGLSSRLSHCGSFNLFTYFSIACQGSHSTAAQGTLI